MGELYIFYKKIKPFFLDYYPDTLMIRNGILKNFNNGNSEYETYEVMF